MKNKIKKKIRRQPIDLSIAWQHHQSATAFEPVTSIFNKIDTYSAK